MNDETDDPNKPPIVQGGDGFRYSERLLAENAGIVRRELDEDSRPRQLSDDDMPLDLALDDNPELRLRIGRYLGGVRKLKKISQERAARDLAMSRPHLSNIEQGRSRTGWKGLRAMATYYQYGMRALIEEVQAAEVSARPAPRLALIDAAGTAAGPVSEDDALLLALFKMLDPPTRQRIGREMLQAVQERVAKITAT